MVAMASIRIGNLRDHARPPPQAQASLRALDPDQLYDPVFIRRQYEPVAIPCAGTPRSPGGTNLGREFALLFKALAALRRLALMVN
jgi:hypothetical protein